MRKYQTVETKIKQKQSTLQTLLGNRRLFMKMSRKHHEPKYNSRCDESDLWYTEMCKHKDSCTHFNCTYAHFEEELRPRPETTIKKSVPCRNGQKCPYGPKFNNGVNKCRFLHDGETGYVAPTTVRRHKNTGKWRTKDCRSWKTNGSCPFHNNCAYKHDPNAPMFLKRKMAAIVTLQCAMRCFLARKTMDQKRNIMEEETIVLIEIFGARNVSSDNLKVLGETNMEVKRVSNDGRGLSKFVMEKETVGMLPKWTRQTSDELLHEVMDTALGHVTMLSGYGSYGDNTNMF